MSKIPPNNRAFEVQVRTAQGTFIREPSLIPDDMTDAMATDPSYQSHTEGDDETPLEKDLLAHLQTSAISPEELLIMREEIERDMSAIANV